MADTEGAGRAGWLGGLGVLAVLAAAGAILVRSASAASLAGVAIVSGGVAAVLLLGFPVREIARAAVLAGRSTVSPEEGRCAALVWEAAARNAWVLSAVGAVAGLVAVLCSDFGTISRFVSGVGDRAAGVALGVVLAIVFATPALRTLPSPRGKPDEPAAPPPAWQLALGGAALVALLASPLLGPVGGPFEPRSWLLNGPAWLVTGGGTLALALYLRGIGRGASIVVGLGGAGTVAMLAGLARALQGFAAVSIGEVAGGFMFTVSSGYAALAGLAAVGLPFLDRDARQGRTPPASARWAAYGLPLVVLALLALAVLMVMIPMEKTAG